MSPQSNCDLEDLDCVSKWSSSCRLAIFVNTSMSLSSEEINLAMRKKEKVKKVGVGSYEEA
jgi:hypothetical protein